MHHTNNYHSMYPDFVPSAPMLPLPPPAPKRPGSGGRKGRGRGLAVFLIFLLLIGGTAVALVAMNYNSFSSLTYQFRDNFLPPRDEAPYDDYYDDYYDEVDSTAKTTIKRASTVQGVELMLHEVGGEVLTYQAIYQKCIPSVVSILTTTEDGGASGTGVILTADGYIITNYHVIQGGSSVEVLLNNGRSYDAKLVGGDQTNDLAVLKIDTQGLTPAEFGMSDALQVGDLAFAIGNPLGEELRGTMTEGIISAIDRDVHIDGNVMTLLQTSAAINSGNSGGALINAYGQVIGITNMKMISYFSTIEGLGFAIPSTTTKDVVDELLTTGHIPGRPTLGFTGYSLSPTAAERMGLSSGGVYVQSVEPKSDAHEQGLKAGDVIVECEGKEVSSVEEINAIKAGFEPGDTLSFTVYRNKKHLDMDIRLMERYQLDY